ncbi:MAG: hypothetical protein IKP87_08665 [Victivallales bacterium]|nr:hypothetical protein [Victivallales bacterium]
MALTRPQAGRTAAPPRPQAGRRRYNFAAAVSDGEPPSQMPSTARRRRYIHPEDGTRPKGVTVWRQRHAVASSAQSATQS